MHANKLQYCNAGHKIFMPIRTILNKLKIVQETRAQIWPNLAREYICRFMIDTLSPDSSLFKSAG